MLWGLRSSRTVVAVLAALVFAMCCVWPVIYMLAHLAGPQQVRDAARVTLLDERQRGLLFNTILLGSGTAIVATAVGAPLGFVLGRVALPLKTLTRVALAAPSLLPSYVVALAWTYLGGGAYGVGEAILVLTFVLYPFSMLATEAGLRRVEPRLEEAALLAAAPGRVLRRITLPLAAPSILSAALIIFVLAMSDFAVPGLLRVRVFTTEVFTAFAALYDFSRATALALPLLLVSAVVAIVAAALMGERLFVTRRGSAGSVPVVFDTWQRPARLAVACVVFVSLVAPVAVLGREALRSSSIVEAMRGSNAAVVNSLWLAAVGATAVTGAAIFLGYVRARAGAAVGGALDVLWVVLFTIPSTVVGIGLIGAWNRPGGLGMVYGTSGMLLIGYLARFLPIAALALAATVRSVPLSHEEAAAAAGARWLTTVRRIVLPQVRLNVIAVWVIVFILAFGEVGTSILVAPPGETTLPIRVYTMIANAPPGHAAALALFQSVVIFCPLLFLAIVAAARKPQ